MSDYLDRTPLPPENNQEKATLSEVQKLHRLFATLDTFMSNQVLVFTIDFQSPINNHQSQIPNPKSDGVQALIDQCNQQLQTGNYQGALDSVNRATEMYPNDHRGWIARGELMDAFQQYEEALASFDQALKVKPDLHDVWFNRGIAAGSSSSYNPCCSTG
ncbi:MAG: tetratricopeptide repeat protein [Xenococcaceae cyanobacterium]